MKCPLFAIAWQLTRPGEWGWRDDCLQEECAWWLDDIQMCAFRDIALETRHAQHRIQDIAKKIPLGGAK